jgi:uncharacterized membrane protein
MLSNKMHDRIWEIDFLRGIAIILMIFFHIIFDLNFHSVTNFNISSGLFFFIGRLSALMFIFIAGISLSISYSRVKNKFNKNDILKKFFKRGLKILFLGIVISFITFFYITEGFIIFGVLHFIGISIILSLLFIRYTYMNFLFGLFFIIIGFYLRLFTFDFYFLIPLGFVPNNFWTVDYFPLFPWFGVILIGIFIGNLIYPDFERKYKILNLSNNKFISSLCVLGRNSLYIYFFHQPIIIILIMIFLK